MPSVTLGELLARVSRRTRKLRPRNFNAKVKGDTMYKDGLDQTEHSMLGNHLS